MKYIFLTSGISGSIFELMRLVPGWSWLVPYVSDCMFAPFERHLASPRSVEMFLVHHTISVGDLATLTQLDWRLTIVSGWYPAGPIGVHTVGFATPKALAQVRETFPVHPMTLIQLARRLTITCGWLAGPWLVLAGSWLVPYPSDCEVVL